ncbi:MAG: hypothetical protein EB150_00720 [Nitrososphaeria archaeon]|nr:hypothetical protein [Nitrososphaeria archaeon]NDB50638.1 hypothetical protein [Nitrosopumilaceae archaeon]NDB88038.1 hypothetical protein [Nitrososphaerota archaeon]NDB46218.1 hypothetical protein [Nitrososphaeria archaeon]NDB90259.1 hypothetical protein [Nitrososphaerota archaeon]
MSLLTFGLIDKYWISALENMSSTKCVSCGKSFFSPMGYNKCNTCIKKDGNTDMDNMGHGSCGCGGHHH